MSPVPHLFIDQSRRYLRAEFLPKIEHCLGVLTEEQLWHRPNEHSNSVGNLLLHLAGNVGQWIVSGVGGAPDRRRRQEEFDARGSMSKAEVLQHLRTVLDEADAVLAGLDPSILPERRLIQGRDVTVLEAVYHVVEHFSMHTGQVLYVTKWLGDVDLGFYRTEDGIARRTWSSPN